MTTIIGLSGSLRAGSFNTALLRAAAGLMPDGAQLVPDLLVEGVSNLLTDHTIVSAAILE